MKKTSLAGVAAASIVCLAGTARANVVDLTFEGINANYPGGPATIDGFYNGGTSSDGTSGPNYGISFPANALALCLNSTTVQCSSTSRGGQGDPASQDGGLFFQSGSDTFADVAAGFDTGFSFNYAAPNDGGEVTVWSGLDGTGAQLADLILPTTTSACAPSYQAGFCPFVPIGVTFAGTAESIDFGGVANQIVFDDVTFGSPTPGPVPEPASLALVGTGLAATGLLRRRRR